MKTAPKSWKRNRKTPGRAAWAAYAATYACGVSLVSAQEAAPASEQPPAAEPTAKTERDYRNWFDVSVGGNFVKGDEASFMQRHQIPKDIYGGVSDFHYEQDVGKKGLLEADGRGIFDNNDYSFRLSLENPDLGYVRAGYREFRTWYDGTGGYLPNIDRVIEIYDDELSIDRGEAFFEAGLTLPNVPLLRFRYAHQFRDGRKSSTSWGDTALDLPTGQTRAIVPSFYDIDEERHIFELDAEHTLADTRFGLGLRYELSDQDDSRNMRRRPGEASDRYLTQRESVETDLFNVRAFQETWFTESLLFTTGYSFTTMDTDIGGSRIYGSDYDALYDPLFARRQQRDEGFFGLGGGAKLDQHVMNLSLMFTPWDDFTIVPSLRAEKQEQSGVAHFEETNVGAGPAFPAIIESIENTRERGFTDVSEGIEFRYTGFTNWVLYTRAEWLEGEGDLSEREMVFEEGAPTATSLFRDTDSTRFTQKYVVGANWYPLRNLNMSAQYYHKSRQNDYEHINDATTNTVTSTDRYPAFILDQDFTTDDVNFRVTYRPLTSLSFVSRYDFQISTIDSHMANLEQVESGKMKSHIFGESITWTPIPRLFLQASANYAIDRTKTPAIGIVPGQDLVQESDQDYIDGSFTAGYALTDKTDLQAQYFLYYANNFTDNSASSVPYNVSAEEHGITGTLIHRFSSAMQWTLKYGWFTLSDKTFGGRNDYEAHMLFSSYRFRF